MKPRICLVCDVKGWAFDIIAQELKKQFFDKYDIRIVYYDMQKEPDTFYELLQDNKDCNLIHFFWRKTLFQLESSIFREKVEQSGRDFDEYVNSFKQKFSTGVYDFLYLDKIDEYKSVFNDYAKNYYVTSKKLYEVYKKIQQYKEPTMVVHDMCNFEKFKPININRFKIEQIQNRPLVIGWSGNSKRAENGIDLKGLNAIIDPVLDELSAEGFNIVKHYADRNVTWRPVSDMPQYYSEIDLYLCMSIHEGTPLPVLEAMSCGVPVISTDVGIVREAFGEKQCKYILGDRAYGKNDKMIKRILKEKIVEIYNNRSILYELSKENLISINNYDDGKIKDEYSAYFDKCLN